MTGNDPLARWRNIPLDRVAFALGYRKDPADRARFKRDGSVGAVGHSDSWVPLRVRLEADALEVLVTLVEDNEARPWPLDTPDPVSMVEQLTRIPALSLFP